MKVLYIILGSLCVVLAVLGIVVPLLPTTPFLLLAASLYFRSSPALYKWLMESKYLGEYIRQFREHKAITLRTKIVALTMLWSLMLYRIFFFLDMWWLKLLLAAIAIGVTIHLLSFPTLRKK